MMDSKVEILGKEKTLFVQYKKRKNLIRIKISVS